MNRGIRFGVWAALVVASLVSGGCTGGSGGSGDPEDDLIFLAQLFKGQISLGNVAAYELSDNGVKGDLLAEGQTDANGNIQLGLNDVDTRFILVAGWGGVIDDPFSGNRITIPATDPLCAVVDTQGDFSIRYQINPMTTWLSKWAEEEARAPSVDMAAAYNIADFGLRYRFELDTPIAEINERDLLASQPLIDDGTELGQLAAMICEYAARNTLNPFEVVYKLGEDLRDGSFDGAYRGSPIRWLTGGELGDDIWDVKLRASLDDFWASALNVNGYDADDSAVDEAIENEDSLTRAPGSIRIAPRHLVEGEQTSFEIWGTNLPSISDILVRIGGIDVDSADIEDNGDDGYRITARIALTDQLTFGANLRYDVEIGNGETGQSTTVEEALGSVQRDEPPIIDANSLDYRYHYTNGGGVFRVRGWNFKVDTKFFVGSEEADVLAVSPPNVAQILLPPTTAGIYNLRAVDAGGSDTASNAITTMDTGAATALAGTDLRPRIGIGIRYRFAGEFSTETFDWRITYTTPGTGSFLANTTTASESQPTLRDSVDSGNVFPLDRGLEWSHLLDNQMTGFNNFNESSGSGDYAFATGPNTLIGYVREPTSDVGESQVEGDYNVVLQMWNFRTGEWRQMIGSFTMDGNGTGYLGVDCRTSFANGDPDTRQPLSVQLEYDLGLRGKISYLSATPGFDFQATAQTGADGRIQVLRGASGTDWLAFGVISRVPEAGESDCFLHAGGYRGSMTSLRASGQEASIGRLHTALGYDDGAFTGFTLDEGVDADTGSPDGDFRWNVQALSLGFDVGGSWFDEDNDRGGFFVAGGDHAIGFSNSEMGIRASSRLPNLRSGYSLEGTHNYGLQAHVNDDADDDTFQSITQVGQVEYFAPSVAGFSLSTSYADQGNTTKYTARNSSGSPSTQLIGNFDLGLTVVVFNVFDQYFKIVTDVDGMQSPYFGFVTPFFFGSGRQGGDTTLWSNYGSPGPQWFLVESRAPDTPDTSIPDGTFRYSSIGAEYVAGDLNWNALKLEFDYSGGSASVSGKHRRKLQDTSAVDGDVSFSSSTTFGGDGFFTAADSDGQDYRGFRFAQGKAFFRMNITDNLRQDVGFGVQASTSMPPLRDQFGFQYIVGFDAPNKPFVTIAPIVNLFGIANNERGTGTYFYQDPEGNNPWPFQYYNDNEGQIDGTGGFEFRDRGGYTWGGITGLGGFSSTLAGMADEITNMYARFTVDF